MARLQASDKDDHTGGDNDDNGRYVGLLLHLLAGGGETNLRLISATTIPSAEPITSESQQIWSSNAQLAFALSVASTINRIKRLVRKKRNNGCHPEP